MDQVNGKIKLILNKAKEKGYEVEVVNKEYPVFSLTKNDVTKYIFGKVLPINNSVSVRLAKRKELTKIVLDKVGIATPKGIVIKSFGDYLEESKKIKLNFPLVVKPSEGSLGRLVAANITNINELKIAIETVADNNEKMIVEEFFNGEDYRITVLDGKVLAVVRKIFPYILGDGISTVGELFQRLSPKRFNKSESHMEVEKELLKQNLTLQSILEKNRKVYLRGSSNAFVWGMTEDLTDKIHPKMAQIALKAADALGLRFGGVDLMTKDITKDTEYKVIEINGFEGFDIHINPDFGKSRDISGQIIKAMFKK